jgi:hypothetical protein
MLCRDSRINVQLSSICRGQRLKNLDPRILRWLWEAECQSDRIRYFSNHTVEVRSRYLQLAGNIPGAPNHFWNQAGR